MFKLTPVTAPRFTLLALGAVICLGGSTYCTSHLAKIWHERQHETLIQEKGLTAQAKVLSVGKAPPDERRRFGHSPPYSHALSLGYRIAGTAHSCSQPVYADTGYRVRVGSMVTISYLPGHTGNCRIVADESATLDDLDAEILTSGLVLILALLGLAAAFTSYFSKRKPPLARFTCVSASCPECGQAMDRGVLDNAFAVLFWREAGEPPGDRIMRISSLCLERPPQAMEAFRCRNCHIISTRYTLAAPCKKSALEREKHGRYGLVMFLLALPALFTWSNLDGYSRCLHLARDGQHAQGIIVDKGILVNGALNHPDTTVPWENHQILVAYSSSRDGARHTCRIGLNWQVYQNANIGAAVAIRYLPHGTDNCETENGLARSIRFNQGMALANLLLFVPGFAYYIMGRRRFRAPLPLSTKISNGPPACPECGAAMRAGYLAAASEPDWKETDEETGRNSLNWRFPRMHRSAFQAFRCDACRVATFKY